MLLKNNRKPEVAYAACGGNKTDDRSVVNDFITRMSASEDDFGNFGSGASKKGAGPARKAPKKSAKQPFFNKNINFKPFIFAGIAVVALVVIISLIAIICNIPGSGNKIDDNVYFTYIDEEGKYHVVVNGDELKKPFENEIELIPAADNSFAYILEKVEGDSKDDSGIKMHVLTGKKLKTSLELADECISFAKLKPGIVYIRDEKYRCFIGGDSDSFIVRKKDTNNSVISENFIISDDAGTIVYTYSKSSDTDGEDYKALRYYQNSSFVEFEGVKNIIPIAISSNGRYIYGKIDENADDQLAGKLCFIDAKEKEVKPKIITGNSKYGIFGEITAMNTSGNEIIFYTETETNGVLSFRFSLKDKKVTALGPGIFKHMSVDPTILTPDSFVGEYFTVKNDDIDDENSGAVSTYCLKKNGAVKVTNADGKFSPDGKYFYFVDEKKSQLARIPLSAKDYKDSVENVLAIDNVKDFVITQKGNIYILDGEENDLMLTFLNPTVKNKSVLISDDVNQDTLMVCANTIYFSVGVIEDGDEATAIFMSTDGGAKVPAEFKSVELTKSPTIVMGVGKNGYAYVTDDNDVTMLFYTSGGKKFNLITDNCTLPKAQNSNGSAIG